MLWLIVVEAGLMAGAGLSVFVVVGPLAGVVVALCASVTGCDASVVS